MSKTNEVKIQALKAAIRSLEMSKRQPTFFFNPPWRNFEQDPDEVYDPKEIEKEIDRLEYEIISLEISEEDPEQRAEMEAEINAAIAISGNWNDEARYYMHTDMEEERFQRGIEAQVDYDMRMERGDYDCWSGPCDLCGSYVDEESYVSVCGRDGCQKCANDIKPLMEFIAQLCGLTVLDDIYGRNPQIRYLETDEVADNEVSV